MVSKSQIHQEQNGRVLHVSPEGRSEFQNGRGVLGNLPAHEETLDDSQEFQLLYLQRGNQAHVGEPPKPERGSTDSLLQERNEKEREHCLGGAPDRVFDFGPGPDKDQRGFTGHQIQRHQHLSLDAPEDSRGVGGRKRMVQESDYCYS